MERGRRLDRAWETRAPALDPADRPWVQELTYGVVRLKGRLDYLLDLHLRKGLGSVAPEVATLLRMGAYQLLQMGSVPSYAAVSETVDAVRQHVGGRLAGMANGVLRSLGREGDGPERFPSLDRDPAGHLTSWGSHPRWLVDRWIGRWGVEQTVQLVEHDNRIPGLYLRVLPDPERGEGGVRPSREAVEEALTVLRSGEIDAEPGPEGSLTIALASGTDPERALSMVQSVVQDPAASWVVRWVGDVWGLSAADLCAAPGGKTMGLWSGGARVVAADASPPRLERVLDAGRRLGAGVPVLVARAEAPALRPRELVLVDAPCTGTGTLARHPDARWRLRPAATEAMAEVQDRILDGAASVVAPGGLLVYSTCSLEPEENDDRVRAFLDRHPDFRLTSAGEGRNALPADIVDPPFLRVLPQRTGTDGAFAASLRRG